MWRDSTEPLRGNSTCSASDKRLPAPRPGPRTAPALTNRHRSERHRLTRGEVRWPVTGEAAVMPGGTGRGGALHRGRAA
jgi:hypothetical protein